MIFFLENFFEFDGFGFSFSYYYLFFGQVDTFVG